MIRFLQPRRNDILNQQPPIITKIVNNVIRWQQLALTTFNRFQSPLSWNSKRDLLGSCKVRHSVVRVGSSRKIILEKWGEEMHIRTRRASGKWSSKIWHIDDSPRTLLFIRIVAHHGLCKIPNVGRVPFRWSSLGIQAVCKLSILLGACSLFLTKALLPILKTSFYSCTPLSNCFVNASRIQWLLPSLTLLFCTSSISLFVGKFSSLASWKQSLY